MARGRVSTPTEEPPLFDGTPPGQTTDEEPQDSKFEEEVFRPPVRSLHTKLSDIYAVVGRIPKTGTAPVAIGGFNFVEADKVAEVVRIELSLRQITLMPIDMTLENVRQTKNGTPIETWKVTWMFVDGETGESHIIMSVGSGADTLDKAAPKAQTNAMKYALLMAFLIPTGDDPERTDAEADVGGPIVINGSAIPGVAVGGSQSVITNVQMDEIRRLAREKQLDPLMMKEVIASVSRFPMENFPAAGTIDEMRTYIIDVLGELSFSEAASLIEVMSSSDDAA